MTRVIPGIHSVREVLRMRPDKISELWIREGTLHDDLNEFHEKARQAHLKVNRVSQKRLDQEVESHQGVIAFVSESPKWPSTSVLKNEKKSLIFALDCLEDPHNVGSLMRSGWGLGIHGVLLTKDRSAGISAAAHKVASGAFEHIPVLETPNLHAELKTLKEIGYWVYGMAADAIQFLAQTKWPSHVVLVVGAEATGLRKSTLSACDALVKIPQMPQSHSYNAAIAGAVGAYEVMRLAEFKSTQRS